MRPLILYITAIEIDTVHKTWPGVYSRREHEEATHCVEKQRNSISSLVAAFAAALMEASEHEFPLGDPRGALYQNENLRSNVHQTNQSSDPGFDLAEVFACWRKICESDSIESDLESPLDRMLRDFQRLSPSLEKGLIGRAAFATGQGLVGFGPSDARHGDVVVVALGASVPFVLRPTKQGFRLVGDAYVDGIMHGEMVRLSEEHPDTVSLDTYGLV
ncbi:hypothetical protein K431DRAFT_302549 [Polychaeton citri CBS 116435]|uniref:Uncharacterized protein n=1 Tax=Polychaeton citri CBS 116435 TaxID=1314669 RepID=A0A9P4URW1_9PEZI|nr:hypothetical protein K431DRAFT_302549 [Polychaeton citri CBS 116435]